MGRNGGEMTEDKSYFIAEEDRKNIRGEREKGKLRMIRDLEYSRIREVCSRRMELSKRF